MSSTATTNSAGPTRRSTASARSVESGRVVPSAQREQQDRLVVTSLVAVFALLAMAVASLTVRGNLRANGSRLALSGTLHEVATRQTDFRIIHQRFAAWDELRAEGMALPPTQQVVRTNATPSHWFLAVRDTATGVICERTGELWDEAADERSPVCRETRR